MKTYCSKIVYGGGNGLLLGLNCVYWKMISFIFHNYHWYYILVFNVYASLRYILVYAPLKWILD